jgi:hypothetical protein
MLIGFAVHCGHLWLQAGGGNSEGGAGGLSTLSGPGSRAGSEAPENADTAATSGAVSGGNNSEASGGAGAASAGRPGCMSAQKKGAQCMRCTCCSTRLLRQPSTPDIYYLAVLSLLKLLETSGQFLACCSVSLQEHVVHGCCL